ncbi:MAG: hypothetical protein ABIF77_05180 [bacterium]
MAESHENNRTECESLADQLAWYPTAILAEKERQQVEEHVATCAACADLLEFASRLSNGLEVLRATHPESEILDHFVVTPDSLRPRERADIENHLAICADCSQVVETLTTVVQETTSSRAGAELDVPPDGAVRRSVSGGFWNRCWDLLTASLLRPIPAAVYFLMAISAIFLVLTRSNPEPAQGPVIARESFPPRAGPRLGNVILLADLGTGQRGFLTEEEEPPIFAAATNQFLLLEITSLITPPGPEELFEVGIVSLDSTEPVWVEQVRGKEFSENYSLCLFLESGVLPPGRHAISVRAVTGEQIFWSVLEVR